MSRAQAGQANQHCTAGELAGFVQSMHVSASRVFGDKNGLIANDLLWFAPESVA